MRAWSSVVNTDFLQNGFQFIGDTLTGWYQTVKNIFSDEAPFFLEVEKEPGYQQFQQWCSDLKHLLRTTQKVIEHGGMNPIHFRENLLWHQKALQENIVSLFYYQQQLTQFKEKLKQNSSIPAVFLDIFRETKARLKEQLETQPEVAESYFYNDLINHVIAQAGKANANALLKALLRYYKGLVKIHLYESIEKTIEHFIEKSYSYYEQEENVLKPLPDALIKHVLKEINASFLKTCAEKNRKEEIHREDFVTRFSNVLQDTTLALQSGLQDIANNPKKLAAVGTASALGYLCSISGEKVSSGQTINFMRTFAVTYGINILSGNQVFSTSVSMAVNFASLLQPIVAEGIQTIEKDTSTLTKRRGSAAQVPIISVPVYFDFVGSYDTPGNAQAVIVSDDLAYIADGGSGLQIINVSVPSMPSLVGNYDTPDYAFGIVLSDNLVYVADGYSGLQIIDVSMPNAPTLVGNYDTPGRALDIAISNNLAYIADYYSGLEVIDVTLPSTPTLLGNYNTPGISHGVAVSRNLAYVADWTSGLQIINISTSTSPTLISNYDTLSQTVDVAVSENLAYVGDFGVPSLYILDISTVNSPTLVGNYTEPSYVTRRIKVSDTLAYIAGFNSGLQILNVSTPNTPYLIGSYDTPSNAYDVVVSGNLVYVVDELSGLQIIAVDFIPILSVNTLTIMQGQARIFDNSNLFATDQDNDNNTLVYIVDNIQRGFFRIVPTATTITEFTQQQVSDSDIEFVHDGSVFAPSYRVSVSDGIARTPPETVTINFSLLPTTTDVAVSTTTTATAITTNDISPIATTSLFSKTNSDEISSSSEENNLLLIIILSAAGAAVCVGMTALIGYVFFRKRQQNTVNRRSSDIELDFETTQLKKPASKRPQSGNTSTIAGILSRPTIGEGEYEIVTDLDPEGEEHTQMMQQVGFIHVKDEQNSGKAIIGHGAFGNIYIGKQLKSTDRNKLNEKTPFVALKEIRSKEGLLEIDAESHIQDKLHHKNILRVLEYVDIEIKKDTMIRYVVLPLMSMDLKMFSEKIAPIAKMNFIQLNQLALFYKVLSSMARDVAEGLRYLHTQKIAHHDLKPENVLIHTQEGTVKISDFGVSKEAGSEEKPASLIVLSPEQVEAARKSKSGIAPKGSYDDYLSDVWAYGLLVLKLLANHFPLDMTSWKNMLNCFTTQFYEECIHSVPEKLQDCGVSNTIIGLLMDCLCIDPKERIDANGILAHDAMNGNNVYSTEEGYQAPLTDMFRLFQSNNDAQFQQTTTSVSPARKRTERSRDPEYMPVSKVGEGFYYSSTEAVQLSNVNSTGMEGNYDVVPSEEVKNEYVGF